MASVMWRITLAVLLLAAIAGGQRETGRNTRPLASQQQQQQLQQRTQQQQLQQRAQQQHQQHPVFGSNVPKADIPLTELTPEHLNAFLRSEQDVLILTNCFANFKACKSPHAINLINQIRTLGIGGTCPKCTSQQQKHLHEMIYNFVSGFQIRYPDQWRQLLPNIGSLLVV